MVGRKPKPIELKVIHGGKYKEAELRAKVPKPRRVLPRCPDYLTGEAEACWKRTAKELYDAGLLTSVDRDALALYCSAFARWREAEAKLVTDGLIVTTNVKTDKNGDVIGGGNEVQSPYLAVANRAQETMIKLQEQFGMTPSSRMRVSIAKPDAQRAAKAAVNMGETAEVAEALQVLTA